MIDVGDDLLFEGTGANKGVHLTGETSWPPDGNDAQ